MNKKILLTGASGFLGHYLCLDKPVDIDIHGLHLHNAPPANIESTACDLQNEKSLLETLRKIKPQGIVHTAAISNPQHCEENPALSKKVNIQASAVLAKYAADQNIPFVFTSTDLVFDGKKGNYTEKDQPNPLNIYGLQKVEAEQEILRVYSNAAICRMPLMLGNAEGFHEKFLQQFLSKTTKKESMPLFTDEYRSPLGGNSAAKGLWLALEKMQGLYHLGGTERLSRWGLGLIIAEKFGIDKQLLKAGKQADLKGKAPRPADVSLNSSKAVKLDFKPKRIAEDLD